MARSGDLWGKHALKPLPVLLQEHAVIHDAGAVEDTAQWKLRTKSPLHIR